MIIGTGVYPKPMIDYLHQIVSYTLAEAERSKINGTTLRIFYVTPQVRHPEQLYKKWKTFLTNFNPSRGFSWVPIPSETQARLEVR